MGAFDKKFYAKMLFSNFLICGHLSQKQSAA